MKVERTRKPEIDKEKGEKEERGKGKKEKRDRNIVISGNRNTSHLFVPDATMNICQRKVVGASSTGFSFAD